jgi:hypothetical protein
MPVLGIFVARKTAWLYGRAGFSVSSRQTRSLSPP